MPYLLVMLTQLFINKKNKQTNKKHTNVQYKLFHMQRPVYNGTSLTHDKKSQEQVAKLARISGYNMVLHNVVIHVLYM